MIQFAEGLLSQQDANQEHPLNNTAQETVAPATQQRPTAEVAAQQQAAVAPAAQQQAVTQQQTVAALTAQVQQAATMCEAMRLVMAGQLSPASIPTVVPANYRRQNQHAVKMAKSCVQAIRAIQQRQAQLQQQQQQQQQRSAQSPAGELPAKLLHESQNGFRPGRSCADHQFVLHQLLTGRRAEKKHSYALFVDTYKAFPTVWHDGLFHKLWENGC